MRWPAIGRWQRRIESNHLSSSSYNSTRSCQRTQHCPLYRKVKKLSRWVPHELTENYHFKVSSSLILCNNNEPLLHWIMTWQKVDFIQPTVMGAVGGPRRSSKAVPRAKLAPRKGSRSLFGGLLPIRSIIAFGILMRPLCLRRMLSKSIDEMHQKTCNACS